MNQDDKTTNLLTLHQKIDEYSRKIAKRDYDGAMQDLDEAINVCPAGLFLSYLQHERASLRHHMPAPKKKFQIIPPPREKQFRSGVMHSNDVM